MGQISKNEETDELNETTTFDASAYIKFLKDTFEIYECNFDEWFITLIGDNISTNKKVADVTNKRHVGCMSHKLDLKVRHMIENNRNFKTTLSTVHTTMKQVKTRLKNAAVLRNLCDLNAIIGNSTRWSSKFAMLKRFLEIRNELIDACEHPDADFMVNATDEFSTKTQKYYLMLSEIDVVTKSI